MTDELPLHLKNCPVGFTPDLEPSRNIVVIPKSHGGKLTDKQMMDYQSQRVQFLSWLLKVGKKPDEAKGYSPYTVFSDAARSARFDLWVWNHRGQYVYPPTQQDATDFIEHLAYADDEDIGRVEKGKLQEAMKHFSKWLHHERGRAVMTELNFREVGIPVDHIAFALCILVANADVLDGTRYWPYPDGTGDRDFERMADVLDLTVRKQMSAVMKMKHRTGI